MFFISSKKLFSFSRNSNFYDFFLSFPHFPDSKEQMEVEQFTMSRIDLHKFSDVIWNNSKTPLHYIIKLGQIIYNE